MPRTLPLRVEPVPGESLDSWLHAYATRLGVSVTRLLDGLGVRPRERPQSGTTVWLTRQQLHGSVMPPG